MERDKPNGATGAKSALEQLPTEITQHIFGYLDLRGVDNLALTSKQLYATLKHGERTILCQWIESHIEPELISLAMVYLVAKRAAWKPTIGEHIQGTWRELCSHISKFGKQYLAREALQLTLVPAEVDRTLAVRMVSVHRAILAHSRYYFSFVTLFDPSPTELFRFHRIMYIMEIIRILLPAVPPRGEPDPIVHLWPHLAPWEYRQARFIWEFDLVEDLREKELKSTPCRVPRGPSDNRWLANKFGVEFIDLNKRHGDSWLRDELRTSRACLGLHLEELRTTLDHPIGSWSWFMEPYEIKRFCKHEMAEFLRRYSSRNDSAAAGLWLHQVLFLGTEINKDQEPLIDAFDEHSLFWDRERIDKETPYLAGTHRFVTADEVASGADGIMLDFRLHDSCSELRKYNDPFAWLDQWL
ncbi:hypothetical protein JX266_006175 [Neoarthrinium moseri]|nr:hypothetical protein JX266_006175 [Neoarthrinium moseri]